MADRRISEFLDGDLVQTGDEIAAVRGGQNYKVRFGSAASMNAGQDIGELLIIEDVDGTPALPALDASQLVNIPVTSGQVAVSENDPVEGYLQDKFVAGDNVTLNTITYSDGSEAIEISASGGGGTGTVLLSDIQNIANNTVVANISGGSASPAAVTLVDFTTAVGLNNARRMVIGPSSVAGLVEVQLTGVPIWAKRITVICSDVNPTNNQPCVLRAMVGGASVNSGYDGMTSTVAATNLVTSGSNSGYFLLSPASPVGNALSMSGGVDLVKVDDDLWSVFGVTKARTNAPNATSNSVVAGVLVTTGAIDGIIVRGGGTAMVSGLVTVIVEG